MAEGTCTGEMPSFDPSLSSEAKKRPISSDGSESHSGLFLKSFCALCLTLHPHVYICLKIFQKIFLSLLITSKFHCSEDNHRLIKK